MRFAPHVRSSGPARVAALAEARPWIRVLSLDVFDTLLVRTLDARTVEQAAARSLARRLGVDAAVITAHRDAFRIAAKRRRRGEQEWTVTEWLGTLADTLQRPPAEVVALGLEAEFDAERRWTTLDVEAREIVNAARDRHWQTVAVSDTWHDEPFVEALLAAHGIAVDRVFTSASRGAGKYDGGLFAIVEAALGADPRTVAHIGDHPKSDWVRPSCAGWLGRWRPRPSSVLGLESSVAHALRAPGSTDPDPLVATSHDLLAPIVLAHALAVRAQSASDRVDAVGYLARDGWLFERAVRALEQAGVAMPANATLRLSRRALTLAHPGRLLERPEGVAGKVGKRTLGERIGAFDLPEDTVAAIFDAAGVGPSDVATDATLQAFAAGCAANAGAIEEARRAQRDRLARFLAQHFGGARHIALVDTGWAGTVQDAVASAWSAEGRVSGWYLGVNGLGAPSTAQSTKEGWCWDVPRGRSAGSPWERSAGVIRCWEVLLREPVPSVARLVESATGVAVEPTGGVDITPEARAAAARIAAGVDAGIRARLDGAVALVAADGVDAEACRALVAACATSLTTRPRAGFARALLAMTYGEGGTTESTTALGWAGLRTGTTWVPGALAAGGLGPVSVISEPLASVAASIRLRGRTA